MSNITFPIQEFFPKDDYKSRCRQNRLLTPIYLIAQQQKIETICEQYERYHRDPSYAEPRFKLTALAVATMMSNHPVMQYLLNRGVDQTSVDHGGLTPLHYACALKDTKSMQLLGESRTVYEIFPGWKKVINPEMPKDDAVVIQRQDSAGNMTPLTAQQFQVLTGARFYDGIVASEQVFINLLAERLGSGQTKESLKSFLIRCAVEQFDAFEKSPSKLYLGPQGPLGLEGVFAGENLSIGSIVAAYAGEAKGVSSDASKQEYTLVGVDATKVRNAAGMVNDSFPNCYALPIGLSDGRTFSVFIALADIKKDTPLFCDYTFAHFIKMKRPHQELNSQALEKYFSLNPPLEILCYIEQLNEKLSKMREAKQVFEAYAKIKYLQYLFHTPASLYTLILKGVLTKNQLCPLEGDERLYSWLEVGSGFPLLEGTLKLLFSHLEFLSGLCEDKSSEGTQLKIMLLNFLENYSYQSFSWLTSCLSDPRCLQTGSWKKELSIYPNLIEGTQFLLSLLTLSSTDEVDQAAFSKAMEQISQHPLYKKKTLLFLERSCQIQAPHLLPLFLPTLASSILGGGFNG